MSPSAPARDRTARLIFLADALDDLDLLLRSADCWLSREKCDAMAAEAEVIVRALAACVEARIPAVVVPMLDDPRIDEAVEFCRAGVRKNFERIDRIVPESSTSQNQSERRRQMEYTGKMEQVDAEGELFQFTLAGKRFVGCTGDVDVTLRRLPGQTITLVPESDDAFSNNADHCFIETMELVGAGRWKVWLGS
jgi:hypothetical protein